jgi:cell wall-associated NlpC family hydrolase
MSIKVNPSVQVTGAEAAARAEKEAHNVATGLPAFYKLGTGGRNPANDYPQDDAGKCDCSGFIAWAVGYDRFQGYDVHGEERWINTDAILYAANPSAVEPMFDTTAALRPDGKPNFRLVERAEKVAPGDLLVYGSTHVAGARIPGHVGLIVNVGGDFVRRGANWWKHLSVAHCSPSNSKKFGPGHAIAVTDATIWHTKGYIVRPTFYL